jgi:hypothetical protein
MPPPSRPRPDRNAICSPSGEKAGSTFSLGLSAVRRAAFVNRIPDVIAAAPGFTTTEKMPTNAFRARNLSFYVK